MASYIKLCNGNYKSIVFNFETLANVAMGSFSKTSLSIVEAVCRAAITIQQNKTFVNFGSFY